VTDEVEFARFAPPAWHSVGESINQFEVFLLLSKIFLFVESHHAFVMLVEVLFSVNMLC